MRESDKAKKKEKEEEKSVRSVRWVCKACHGVGTPSHWTPDDWKMEISLYDHLIYDDLKCPNCGSSNIDRSELQQWVRGRPEILLRRLQQVEYGGGSSKLAHGIIVILVWAIGLLVMLILGIKSPAIAISMLVGLILGAVFRRALGRPLLNLA